MPLDNPRGGFALAPEFQSSALPWVQSSNATVTPENITFNYISRFISLTNLATSGSLYLGFTQNGMSGNNYATIPAGDTLTLEWRVNNVWIAASAGTIPFSLQVGLTTVPAGQMPILSGSGPTLGGQYGANWAGVG